MSQLKVSLGMDLRALYKKASNHFFAGKIVDRTQLTSCTKKYKNWHSLTSKMLSEKNATIKIELPRLCIPLPALLASSSLLQLLASSFLNPSSAPRSSHLAQLQPPVLCGSRLPVNEPLQSNPEIVEIQLETTVD